MLEHVFEVILNMSITASIAAIVIIGIRAVLKNRLPKTFSYALWAILLLRLLVPASIPSIFSVFNIVTMMETNVSESGSDSVGATKSDISNGVSTPGVQSNQDSDSLKESLGRSVPAPAPEASADPLPMVMYAATWIWLVGAVGLLVLAVISYYRTLNKLKTAVISKDDPIVEWASHRLKMKRKVALYTSDRISSPVVCGLIRPRIIVPLFLMKTENDTVLRHIVTHELVHIRRFDYLIKPLAFVVLCLHWFNPILWLSFVLANKDMELSCDEKVLSVADNDIKSSYANSLIQVAVRQQSIMNAGSLAFGESHIKSRITSIMHFKRSSYWMSAAAVSIVIVLGILLLTNANTTAPQPGEPQAPSGAVQPGDKNWEVVSRSQRVQGEISEMKVTEGTLDSLTLSVIRNIPLPNNPVDQYYETGEKLHIIFDEKLENAGNAQEKLKQGAQVVVTFAQYAIPPEGEVVLGASFDRGVYYVENGKYYDLDGKEVDLVPALDREFIRTPEVEFTVDLEVERDLQEQVDQGHKPMMLDELQVTRDYISRLGDTGSSELKAIQQTDRVAIVEIIADQAPVKRVYLEKLIRQDQTGIWTIVGYDPWNPEEETKVILENKPDMISDLDMNISGKIEGKPIPYFFYQVEDGHGYLSEGRVEVQANGSFASTIRLKSPTNGYGTINFYGDVKGNGQFDIEEDTDLKLGFADLVFEPSLVVH